MIIAVQFFSDLPALMSIDIERRSYHDADNKYLKCPWFLKFHVDLKWQGSKPESSTRIPLFRASDRHSGQWAKIRGYFPFGDQPTLIDFAV